MNITFTNEEIEDVIVSAPETMIKELGADSARLILKDPSPENVEAVMGSAKVHVDVAVWIEKYWAAHLCECADRDLDTLVGKLNEPLPTILKLTVIAMISRRHPAAMENREAMANMCAWVTAKVRQHCIDSLVRLAADKVASNG